MTDEILAVCDFPGNADKTEEHLKPLAEIAETTMVSITRDEDVQELRFRTVPSFGLRPVGLALMFVRALVEALRHDYDGIVSFSLVPHGCFALTVGRLTGTPVHLGILGIDLDVHARARYGPPVRFLIRRFDVVSVPGTAWEERLLELGLERESTAVLVNPVDVETFGPTGSEVDRTYDLLWIGRLARDKDPLLFVETVSRLRDRGVEVTAVIVGDGPIRSEVETAVSDHGLGSVVEITGWVDDPVEFYRDSRVFVLTSRRDALPLTLIEAMATGLACVVHDVGNVSDVVENERNAVVVSERTPRAYARRIERLLASAELYERISQNAPDVRSDYSYEAASEDWGRVLDAFRAKADPGRR